MSQDAIDALLQEERAFSPSAEFVAQANANDPAIYDRTAGDYEAFWAEQAKRLEWIEPWRAVLEWSPPNAKWFLGGKLNASANCLDRHVKTWRRNKAALIWEGEPGDERVLTYADLYRETCKFANVLKSLGVKKGDRVCIYMGLVPEVVVAMLACARIGAPHSVVFGGFSAESLVDRINDAESNVLITADGGWRRGSIVPLKKNADEALARCPTIKHCVVLKRIGDEIPVHMEPNRDVWWHEAMQDASRDCEPEPMDSEDLLYLLYTSGSTGKPKGIMHTTGGYMTGVTATSHYVFDLKEEDVFWCTADVGWVTGHSYIVYGPLSNGASCIIYEGAPDYPDRDRFWQMVAKYRPTVFYTAPTAIRAFMKWGDHYPAKHDLSSLRLLGTVGEPINPEAWMWYHKHIGRERCPIVDTWWQTETGSILITPLPGLVATKPGSATKAFPGIFPQVLDAEGNPVPPGKGGYLALTKPWPSMLRGIYGDPERFREVYWSKYPGIYFTGDGARQDEDGYFWLMGRVDDVINVSGHRLSTMEVESALVDHPAVAEAAAIGKNHEMKGQAVAVFVTIREGFEMTDALKDDLKAHVVMKIGALARPDDVIFSADLPKTRSGKIMRRLLRDVAEGRALGDTTTLADPTVVAALKEKYEGQED
ncbi:MAG: acetate--CoA ligase [Armatimonadetes bacterium]|nr:acetate--CoA ligase [Armatimonadota bacterium]